jgi:hypothetical protein
VRALFGPIQAEREPREISRSHARLRQTDSRLGIPRRQGPTTVC